MGAIENDIFLNILKGRWLYLNAQRNLDTDNVTQNISIYPKPNLPSPFFERRNAIPRSFLFPFEFQSEYRFSACRVIYLCVFNSRAWTRFTDWRTDSSNAQFICDVDYEK